MKIDIWKPVDAAGYWIATWWTPAKQVRTGVVLTLGSALMFLYLPFSGEPPVIYIMSAFALLFGGLGIIVTAVLAIHEDPESSQDDLKPKSSKKDSESD